MDPIELINSGKINRYFRATRKLMAPNFVSHVTQRAAGKDILFLENDDYLYMLSVMKDICRRYALNLYAFCLMTNHVHLLLQPSDENLDDAMRDLFARYARWFNKKYERKGHLFGGPYRQAVCLEDSYLLAVSLYIHVNPVRAGIVEKPEDYRWSSVALYFRDNPPRSFVDPAFVLGLLPGNVTERRKRYKELLKRGTELEVGHVLEEEKAIYRYKERLATFFPSIFQKLDKAGKTKGDHVPQASLIELERQIEEMRKNPRPNTPETRKAKRYLVEQLMGRGYKKSEIAEKLGISRKTVYNLLKSPQ